MMLTFKEGFDEDYEAQSIVLGEKGLFDLLEKGKRWKLSSLLSSGGSAIFPHTYLELCGDQIAAVVHGCLDSGADHVLLLGVIHTRENLALHQARLLEAEGKPMAQGSYHGVFSHHPGEYSLIHFKTLWDLEVKRRGKKAPKLIVRYPCLVNGDPSRLPGIEELERFSKSGVVVMTGDLVHNGAAYSTDLHLEIGKGSESFAREGIEELFAHLNREESRLFIQKSIYYRNDARDSLTVMRHLLGKMIPSILELRIIDTSDLFAMNPVPSWVASSLITLEKAP